MGGGGGGSGSTTVRENVLPTWAQPYVVAFWDESVLVYEGGYTTFSGLTYAPMDQVEIDGIVALRNRARERVEIVQGDDYTTGFIGTDLTTLLPYKARVWVASLIAGNEIAANPNTVTMFGNYASKLINDFENSTIPSIESEANMLGRFGGNSHHVNQVRAAEILLQSLGDLAKEIFGADYDAGRDMQMAAVRTAASFADASINDAEALRHAGVFDREYRQGQLEDAYRAWLDGTERRIHQIEFMGNVIRAVAGAQSIKTEPYYRPKEFAQMAGLALAGFSAIGSMYGNKGNAAPAVQGGAAPSMATGSEITMDTNTWSPMKRSV